MDHFVFFLNHIPLIEALKSVKRGSKFQEYTLGHDRYLFFHFEFCGKMGRGFSPYSPTRGLEKLKKTFLDFINTH